MNTIKKIINGVLATLALLFGFIAIGRKRKIEKLEKEVEHEKARASENDFIAQKHEDRQAIEIRNHQIRDASANADDSAESNLKRMRDKGYLRDGL